TAGNDGNSRVWEDETRGLVHAYSLVEQPHPEPGGSRRGAHHLRPVLARGSRPTIRTGDAAFRHFWPRLERVRCRSDCAADGAAGTPQTVCRGGVGALLQPGRHLVCEPDWDAGAVRAWLVAYSRWAGAGVYSHR